MFNKVMELDAPSHNMGLLRCGGVSLVSTVPTLGEMTICPFSKSEEGKTRKVKRRKKKLASG